MKKVLVSASSPLMFMWAIILFLVYSENTDQTCIDGLLNDLPCSSFGRCVDTVREFPNAVINTLSNGNGKSKSKSDVYFCYDNDNFIIQFESFNQSMYSQKVFEDCNDSVYNLDVVELFISPWKLNGISADLAGPYCYSEIDISPFNKVFQSGIYNKNLNHTGVANYPLDCATSGIRSQTDVNKSIPSIWTTTIKIPWSIIMNPNGCPIATSGKNSSAEEKKVVIPHVLRANFYRVNELSVSAGSQCSSSSCEYMAWSPTLSNPPAFHEPTKFGYLIRQI